MLSEIVSNPIHNAYASVQYFLWTILTLLEYNSGIDIETADVTVSWHATQVYLGSLPGYSALERLEFSDRVSEIVV